MEVEMLVRDIVQGRAAKGLRDGEAEILARLPTSLRRDREPARIGMLKRLAATRSFALGQRAGALRTAQARSGRSADEASPSFPAASTAVAVRLWSPSARVEVV